MYARPSSRKNKIWEDDGTLAVENRCLIVRSSSGRELAKRSNISQEDIDGLMEGQIFVVGSKEVQLLSGITDADYKSGAYND